MKRYRCKHFVEAVQWDGTSRELLISWHEKQSGKTPWFRDSGVAVVFIDDKWHTMQPSEWLVWFPGDKEFFVFDAESFAAEYEASP